MRRILLLALGLVWLHLTHAAPASAGIPCESSSAPQCGGYCDEGICMSTILASGATSAVSSDCVCVVEPDFCGIFPTCGGSCAEGLVCRGPISTATGNASTQGFPGQIPCLCQPDLRDDGSSCTTEAECLSGFCVDGVCCNSACDGEGQQCDLDGVEGQCAATPGPAPAPSTSPRGLALGVGLLLVIARLSMRRFRSA